MHEKLKSAPHCKRHLIYDEDCVRRKCERDEQRKQMSMPRKPKNLRLRRKMAKIVSTQRQIELHLDRILRDMKRAGWIIEKTIRKIK